MQNNIVFFQSVNLGTGTNKPGLFEIFHVHLSEFKSASMFKKMQVIVPNHAFASWLRDNVTRLDGVCANLDFVVLVGTVLEQIYLLNNTNAQFFDFRQAKYIIYEYLVTTPIFTEDATELNHYIFNNDKLDHFRVYQLASQLQQIFHEYVYLRTEELLNIDNSKLPLWQQHIFNHLLRVINGRKTFLDIYQYFVNSDLDKVKLDLPERLFIFGLTSIYPSQLKVLLRLSNFMTIYWYYQPCSYEYYGDLLSTKARASLEKKLLRKPDLSIDDLYLTDGNPLLANLGQQSREFIELLNSSGIEVYSFRNDYDNRHDSANSMLSIIQDDIRQLNYRIRAEYRLEKDNRFYVDPLQLQSDIGDTVYDLPNQQNSIKINICHNRMREVQVLFNELAQVLTLNPYLAFSDIMVTAPDIDDYAAYITAVFDNENVLLPDNRRLKLPYAVTGHRQQRSYKIIDTIKLILNLPYNLPVNYLVELLMQTEIQKSLEIDNNAVDLVKCWLADNHTNFGLDETDYNKYGYEDYGVHSLRVFLQNLVLGACIPEPVLMNQNNLPVYIDNNHHVFTPYDNLDMAQINLCNKLIGLIDLLSRVRQLLYVDRNTYTEITIQQLHEFLTQIQQQLFKEAESELLLNKFIGSLLDVKNELIVNLPIINQLIDEYNAEIKSRIRFEGKISCASLQYIRNIPYKVIYVLGLNFGEFPSNYQPNQLSILAKDWYLADRNYNIEDKQMFLDTILAAREQLFLSYIGRKETDNSIIKPSPVLGLFINTLGQSYMDFWDGSDPLKLKYNYKNIITQHSLHPFYNNYARNYSEFWHKLAAITGETMKSRRWDFTRVSRVVLTDEQKNIYYQPKIKDLIETFCYTNRNLYKIIGLSVFDNEIELEDKESFLLFDRSIAKALFIFFNQHSGGASPEEMRSYLEAKGILSYKHVGEIQFDYYWQLYQLYCEKYPQEFLPFQCDYSIKRGDETIQVIINDKVMIDGNTIVICDSYDRISEGELPVKLESISYQLRMKALLISLMVCDNRFVSDGNVTIDGVLIRLLRSNGEVRDFKIWVDQSIIQFDTFIKYYLRSLTYPVLIHRGAIQEYAKKANETDRKGNLKNSGIDCINAAKGKYLADFNNYELESLYEDVIFGDVADNYFELIEDIGGVNDIVRIGEVLSALRG